MKEVKLMKLTLKYFKGVISKEIEFNEKETFIYGDNALCKTTIFDAFTWLCFGRDSEGNSTNAFDIKTIRTPKTCPENPDNSIINHVDHDVEAVLMIDGRTMKLKRSYRENWVKKTGALEATLQGDETYCFFDEIPVQIGEYNRRVNDIIEDSWFKIITDAAYFPRMHWTDRRRILVDLAGDVTMQTVVDMHPEFNELIAQLNGLSLPDFKAKTGAQKTTTAAELKQIPIRIDQERQKLPEPVPVASIKLSIIDKRKEIEEYDVLIGNAVKAAEKTTSLILEKRAEISKLQRGMETAITEAEKAARAGVFEQQQAYENLLNERTRISTYIDNAKRDCRNEELELEKTKINLGRKREYLTTLQEDWKRENAKTINIDNETCIVCPLFGHDCTDIVASERKVEEAGRAIEKFNVDKKAKLATINTDGHATTATIKELEQLQKTQEARIEELRSNINTAQNNLFELNNLIGVTVKPEPKAIIPNEIPAVVEMQKSIDNFEEQIKEIHTAGAPDYSLQKSALYLEIEELNKLLYQEDSRINSLNEISRLESEMRKLSQQLSDIEKTEYLIAQYTKAYMAEVDARVNSKFKYVTFRLFKELKGEGEKECCDILIDGVPFTSANNAARINAGIDIINAICEYKQITAPIFIDNRESVNELIPCNSQIINLVVTKDKELIIK